MSDPALKALGSSSGGNKDEVDRPIVALKFKLAKHQRTVGVAARVPRQREGMEDKVGGASAVRDALLCVFGAAASWVLLVGYRGVPQHIRTYEYSKTRVVYQVHMHTHNNRMFQQYC